MKNTTRLLAALLAVVMLVPSLLVPGYADASFTDVKAGSWYEEAVNYVTEKGFMNGVGDGKFAPNESVTRAMFVTVLYRMEGEPAVTGTNAFADVPDGKWFTNAVVWAADLGITKGTSATTFAPNAKITRQDMCTMLARYLNAKQIELPKGEEKTFIDADKISGYAKEAVALCSSLGLIAGYEDGSFQPTATATRAQLAIILMRLDKALAGTPVDPVPMPAQSFNGEAGEDMSIAVNAPEGALPENTDMTLTRVYDDAVLATIEASAGSKVFAATDISFVKDGAKLEPEKNVEVQIGLDGLENLNNPTVVHLADDGELEYISSELISINRGNRKALRFSAKDFSIYVIVDNNGQQEARATVNFYRDKNADPVKTYYVKNSDTVAEMEKFLADPGIGNVLQSGQIFVGWTIDAADANTDADYDTEHYGVNYSATTKRYTIDGIRSYLAGRDDFVEGQTVINIYPIIYKVYVVSYRDSKGVTMASDNAIMLPSEDTATYKITQDYTVLSQDEHFEGWIPQKDEQGQTHVVTAGTPYYQQGDTITINGDVVFSNEVSTGHWLVFEENGYGATYNAPVFLKQDDVTAEPALEMVRLGYTFDGWWTGAPASEGADPTGTRFTFGNTITERTVLYAKWIQATTATYTVVIWKQNIDGDGYDFVASVPLTGSTTTSVSPVSNATETSCTVNGTTYSYTGFHLGQYDSNVNVKPAGGTVVNVHFDRNEYELQFQAQLSAGYYEVTDPDWDAWANSEIDYYFYASNNTRYTLDVRDNENYYYHSFGTSAPSVTGNQAEGTYFLLIDNTIYSLRRTGSIGNRTWQAYYNGSWTNVNNISGTKYYLIRSSEANPTVYEYLSAGWHTIKSIKALYEQPIGSNFPIVGTNGTTYDNGERWDPQTHTTFKQVLVYIDKMPADNVIFHVDSGSGRPLKTINWMVEALPGTENTSTAAGTLYMYNGTNDNQVSAGTMEFTQYGSIDARYYGVTYEEDFIELPGFTRLGADQPGQSRTLSGTTSWTYIYNTSSNGTINFYYTRNKYKITYSDGTYVDGRGNTLEIPNQGIYKTSDDIVYGADITSYTSKTGANYYTPTAQAGFVLEGWYLDQTCTVPWNSDTMPLNGVQVYAKWRQIEYRVFLKPNALINGNRDVTLDWGTESQATNFRIAYNGEVSIPTGLRNSYEFIGWYTDAGLTVPYNKDTRLTDSTVPADPAYDKTADWTDGEKEVEGSVEQKDMDKWGLIPDGYYGINKDAERSWITRKLVLYCKWSKVLDGSMGIYVHYDANGGTNTPTDSLLYKESATAVAQTAATPADTAKDQFLYWVMQKWDSTANNGAGAFVDVDNTPIYPGQNFILEEQYAQKVEERDDEGNLVTDEHGRQQYIYTVQLRAEYGPLNVALDTHVIWYGNGGTLTGEPSTALTDEYVYSDRTAVNTPIPIKPNLFTHPEGYIFLGWARLDEDAVVVFKTGADGKPTTEIDHFNPQTQLTEDNVWLEFAVKDEQHDNNYFKVNDSTNSTIDGKTVTHIGADDKTPYHVMVAVWSSSQYYYVFHSSTCEIEARPLEKNSTVDLTSLVKPGYLYGGYYKDYSKLNATPETSSVVFDASVQAVYNKSSYTAVVQGATAYDGSSLKVNDKRFWDKADAYTSANNADVGTALQPQGSTVYYLKEVPETYLSTKYVYVYDIFDSNKIIDFYMLSAVDDSYYADIGFRCNTTNPDYSNTLSSSLISMTALTSKFRLIQHGTDAEDKVNEIVATNINDSLTRGYVVVTKYNDILSDNNTFTVMPCWKTLDGVDVYSHAAKIMTLSSVIHPESGEGGCITVEDLPYNRIFVNTNCIDWWNNNNAETRLYFFVEGTDNQNAWAKTTLVRNGVYYADVPAGYDWTHVIVVRGNPNYTALDWGFMYGNNQTGNITLALNNKNYISSFAEGSETVTWGIYNP